MPKHPKKPYLNRLPESAGTSVWLHLVKRAFLSTYLDAIAASSSETPFTSVPYIHIHPNFSIQYNPILNQPIQYPSIFVAPTHFVNHQFSTQKVQKLLSKIHSIPQIKKRHTYHCKLAISTPYFFKGRIRVDAENGVVRRRGPYCVSLHEHHQTQSPPRTNQPRTIPIKRENHRIVSIAITSRSQQLHS